MIRAKSLTVDVRGGQVGMAELDKAARYYSTLAEEATRYYQGSNDTITSGEVAERPTLVAGDIRAVEAMGLAVNRYLPWKKRSA